MTIQELVETVSKRPDLYLGEATLSRFEAFLLGWGLERDNDDGTNVVMVGFQKWIQDSYRIQTSHSWASIIRFYAKNDVDALTEAFKLFKEYFELVK